MTPPGTFDRVYGAIRQQLRDGLYRPGSRLEPAALSDELNASVTPIRDALHRLTGERLVEAPRHEGFRVPMLTETLVRQLYDWHLDLLLLALARRSNTPLMELAMVQDQLGGTASSEQSNALFRALTQLAGNHEHVAALDNVCARLGPVQCLEDKFLDGTQVENAAILAALHANDRAALRRSLVRYHRRRQKIAPQILAEMLHAYSPSS